MAQPQPSDGAQEPVRLLSEHFAGHADADHGSRWDACWQDSWTPWDRGGPSWALYDLLHDSPGLFPSPADGGRPRTALVPGCGRGHDVLLLSELGYDTWGLDISPTGIRQAESNAARKQQQQQQQEEGEEEEKKETRRGKVSFLCADFFADGWRDSVGTGGQFDLIYDYTFFSALPPTMRPAWAARMRDLLLRPGGRLVCLEFPTRKAAHEPGPPWATPPHAYLAYLSRPGRSPAADEYGMPLLLHEGEVAPGSQGLRRLLHASPRRTHPAGAKDGAIQDTISVWAHEGDARPQ